MVQTPVVTVFRVCLQQWVTRGLPQFTRQLPAVLENDLCRDDAQVNGQQLEALNHLPLVVLTVETTQLPASQMLLSTVYSSRTLVSTCLLSLY